MFFFFPACQVRVVRFYVSCLPPPPPPRSPAPFASSSSSSYSSSSASSSTASFGRQCSRWISTAGAGWQRSPQDLNRPLRMAVFPTGPQPRVLLDSVPRAPADLKRQLFVD